VNDMTGKVQRGG